MPMVTALLTHPLQVLVAVVVLVHLVRAALAGRAEERQGQSARRPIEALAPRQAA
jgi:hypothetical protein